MNEERIATAPAGLRNDMGERTPELIGAEIRLYYEAGRRVTMLCGIEIGRRLNEVKELLAHGDWLPWLQREAPFSERHAQNYIKIYREYGAAQQGLFGPETNAKYIADLPISKALLLLAVPEEERDEFAETVEADKLSADELKEAIREKEAAKERIRELEYSLETQEQESADRILALQQELVRKDEETEKILRSAQDDRKRIEELEKRPIEVAVERDEKAIEEAAEAARAESRQELEKLQKKLEAAQKKQDKAEKERDALREKAEKADAAAKEQAEKASADTAGKLAEAERATAAAREELEQMKKKLLASDRDVTEFGVHFKSLQAELRAMAESLDKVKERDSALADKLREAWRKVLTPYMEEEA